MAIYFFIRVAGTRTRNRERRMSCKLFIQFFRMFPGKFTPWSVYASTCSRPMPMSVQIVFSRLRSFVGTILSRRHSRGGQRWKRTCAETLSELKRKMKISSNMVLSRVLFHTKQIDAPNQWNPKKSCRKHFLVFFSSAVYWPVLLLQHWWNDCVNTILRPSPTTATTAFCKRFATKHTSPPALGVCLPALRCTNVGSVALVRMPLLHNG